MKTQIPVYPDDNSGASTLKAQHTPTPWRCGMGRIGGIAIKADDLENARELFIGALHFGASDNIPSPEVQSANADFIVRACNEHAGLVAERDAERAIAFKVEKDARRMAVALTGVLAAFKECVGSEAFAEFEKRNPAVIQAGIALKHGPFGWGEVEACLGVEACQRLLERRRVIDAVVAASVPQPTQSQ